MSSRSRIFEAFLIDKHGAKRTEVAGLDIGESFAAEMRKANLRSLSTGSDFIRVGGDPSPGSDVVKSGITQARSWLWDREEFDGTPKLQVFNHCYRFVDEMSKYRNKLDKGKPTDKPDQSKHSHGPDAFRYAVQHGLEYVAPRKPRKAPSGIHKYWLEKQRRKGRTDYVHLGAGDNHG